MKYEVRERENPYLFLEDLRLKWSKNRGLFESDTVSLRMFQVRKKMNSQKCSRENWKSLKTDHFCAKHAIFATGVQVARASRQNTWKKTFEKFSKCFSWLEVPLARDSRTEPRKSLCTSHDWTFHPRTSRQPELQKTWNSKIFKNILNLFRDWSIYPPMSCQWVAKNLCDGLATGACDWFYPWLSHQNRAT